MKADGVEAIEIGSNIGDKMEKAELKVQSAAKIAKMIAEEAMKSFEPKAGTASTADQLQPQLITCPYCESQEVEVLSNETITSQLCLFEMGAARTETRIKHQDTFICSGCSAIAKLSWREAKKEE